MIHELPLDRRTLHGHFSRDLPPVLTIDPGDSVVLATPNAGWMLDRTTEFEPRSSPEDDGHALAGPIEVRGARAGSTLVVRIDEVDARCRGVRPSPSRRTGSTGSSTACTAVPRPATS